MNKSFQNREFNFVKPGDEEVYIRYLSFDTAEEFKNEVLRVCPKKIDIGAVFTAKVIYQIYDVFSKIRYIFIYSPYFIN